MLTGNETNSTDLARRHRLAAALLGDVDLLEIQEIEGVVGEALGHPQQGRGVARFWAVPSG